ncbi:hypothetical protein [Variovorax boronicumulans]|uniref:hypothetical protein n=1 Tax=Variovorax boronicumulans TaxID=436515 RepID=UPI0012E4C9B1|nr:hypothetical protein [Variovorax boronicumulans]GER09790.1 hypothetical protein VHAB30_09430 [Variovorax boronicumulans]
MLHQTLIVAGVALLVPLALGPVWEPVALVAVTIAGCWLLTDGLIRRIGWLRPLFGLKRKPEAEPAVVLTPPASASASSTPRPPAPGWRSPSPRA